MYSGSCQVCVGHCYVLILKQFLLRGVPWCDHDDSAEAEDKLPLATNLPPIRCVYHLPYAWSVTPLHFVGLFVIVAWLSLFLPPEAIPGRVTMAMTTLLTLAAMFGSVSQNTPKVSYVSALDVWMCSCIVFVFICLLEYVIVLW